LPPFAPVAATIADLINSAVGSSAEKEKKLALSLLHNVIGAKRKGGQQWTKTFELVMKRHLELCVDLKDYRMAKDGLHQYRNLCQSVSAPAAPLPSFLSLDLLTSRSPTDRPQLARSRHRPLDGSVGGQGHRGT